MIKQWRQEHVVKAIYARHCSQAPETRMRPFQFIYPALLFLHQEPGTLVQTAS